uniref:Heterogeneous nuclear ribonucleoprotein M n=1 Tax=Strongyloides papillosus TaxID=174720 RepID=A0A0N5BUQ5_STREA
MCTLYFALNDPTMSNVLLRNLGAMEALEIEFDAYEAKRNMDILNRLNMKLHKFMMICKHLHILDQCTRSPVVDVKVVAQIMGTNNIRGMNGMQNGMNHGMPGGGNGNMHNGINGGTFSRGDMRNSFRGPGGPMHPGGMPNVAGMRQSYPRGINLKI